MKVQEEHDSGTERWLVSYADFITLMFAFFVILYATSERNQEKVKNFQQSVEKYLIKAGSFGESGARVEAGEKNFSVIEPPIPTYRQNKVDDIKLLETVETKFEEEFTAAERKRYLVDIAGEERGVRVVLSAPAIFAGETQKFSSSSMAFIDHFAKIIKAQKSHIMIEGHVSQGERGDFSSPWELASARAVNFLRYLQKKHEFSPKSLAASTFGDAKPLGNGKSDRVEVILYYNDSEL